MGNTEQNQAKVMKRYIREMFIPQYVKSFNKGLFETDIKFYGKIHFNRSHSDNELNMHCHLIVSRKDQSNKKKLSPLTNHKNTKKGTVTGGFGHVNLFQQAEQAFDRLFDYNRQITESFEYYNMMKNDSISEQLDMQEQQIGSKSRKIELNENKRNNILTNIQLVNQESKNKEKQTFSILNLGLSSVLDLLTHESNDKDEQQIPVKRKKRNQSEVSDDNSPF